MTVIHKDQAGEKTKWLVNYLGHCISADSNPHMCVRIIDDDGNYHKVGDLPEWPAILGRASELAIEIEAANERRNAEAAAASEASRAEFDADPWQARIKAAAAKAHVKERELHARLAVARGMLSEKHDRELRGLRDRQEEAVRDLAHSDDISAEEIAKRVADFALPPWARDPALGSRPAWCDAMQGSRPAWQRDIAPAGERQ
jgi:hypothetical protein